MTDCSSILIVDDQPVNIQTLNAVLESDYDTYFATSGQQALEMAGAMVPDLILLDIVMSDMDGYQVCRQLKEDPKTADIPVIFVTGRSGEADEAQGLRLGAVDYIHKPITPPVVKARVDNHILLKRYRDELETLSMQDPLTAIANRRRFDDTLLSDWRRAKRNSQAISLVAMDIDEFKRYNDVEGHPAGDRCLRQVANVLHQCARRPADLACRVGGEEFSCLLPETDAAGALQVAETIRSEIEALAIPHPGSSHGPVLTLSLGVATARPHEGGDPGALLEAADRSLYEAKEAGRNRVGPPKEPGEAVASPQRAV